MKIKSLLFGLALGLLSSCSPSNSEGNFKSWGYSDKAVIGTLELKNTGGVEYYKISKIDKESTKIEKFNANGILKETVVVKFGDGKISSMTHTTNQGFTYQTQTFQNRSGGIFEVSKTWGANDNLPCKGISHIFKNGLIVESTYVGFDEKPCECSAGYATIKFKRYDDKNRWGQIQEKTFFDKKGEAVISGDYHMLKYQRDERGNITNESYWGIDNKAVKTRFGFHEVKRKFDKFDNVMELEVFGLSGEPVVSIYGVSKLLYEYEDGKVSKIIRYNVKNEIVEENGAQINDGAAIIKYKYDERGNLIITSYFDRSEKPMNSNMGYHTTKSHFDKSDNEDELMFYEISGKPVTDKRGIHRYYYLYDELGRNIGIAYYDKQNKPIKDDVDEVFMEKYKYDEEGRIVSVSYWSDENTKMTRWSGIHEYKYKYNEQGQNIEELHLDAQGNLKKSTSGESRTVTEYDEFSRISAYSTFDGEKPVMITNAAQVSNYNKISFEYDNQNRIYVIKYFDTEGNPVDAVVNDTDRVHKIEIEYQGNSVVRENWYRKGSSVPSKIIDCVTSQCMRTSGNGMEYLNK